MLYVRRGKTRRAPLDCQVPDVCQSRSYGPAAQVEKRTSTLCGYRGAELDAKGDFTINVCGVHTYNSTAAYLQAGRPDADYQLLAPEIYGHCFNFLWTR